MLRLARLYLPSRVRASQRGAGEAGARAQSRFVAARRRASRRGRWVRESPLGGEGRGGAVEVTLSGSAAWGGGCTLMGRGRPGAPPRTRRRFALCRAVSPLDPAGCRGGAPSEGAAGVARWRGGKTPPGRVSSEAGASPGEGREEAAPPVQLPLQGPGSGQMTSGIPLQLCPAGELPLRGFSAGGGEGAERSRGCLFSAPRSWPGGKAP